MVNGSVKLFRLFGIDVFLHWSWFIIAVFLVPRVGQGQFTGPGSIPIIWSAALYLSLFAIVLIHEFGHALACRSVGGQAKHIVLWPLGGVAYVSPPQRPGAVLWSIVAGPLVNVMLIPVTVIAYYLVRGEFAFPEEGNNIQAFMFAVGAINFGLLVFNMMPVYPLDGGQTLMALLWFVIGRAKSLKVVSMIGLIVAGGVVLLAIFFSDIWYMAMALFVGLQAWNGYRLGMTLSKIDPKHYDERYANRAAMDEVEGRIQEEVDPCCK